MREPPGKNNIHTTAAFGMKPVWIVDDDRSIRWVFEKALSREGISYSSFSSAREALDALAGGAPQVLVSDIRMPGQSGIELLQEVKERHPAVPVIVMTAYSDLESAVAAFQGGVGAAWRPHATSAWQVDGALAGAAFAVSNGLRDGNGNALVRVRRQIAPAVGNK